MTSASSCAENRALPIRMTHLGAAGWQFTDGNTTILLE
jgi:hypothetical protein